LLRIADRIGAGIAGAKVHVTQLAGEGAATKLVVRVDSAQIKIEVTPVLRGTVYDPVTSAVTPEVEEAFGFAEMRIVSFADLYAGKIVAAMDRQHPRDLFDVRDLLANEGITDDLRRAFIVYLISHGRPMAEVLAPTRKPLGEEYTRGFEGMTRDAVPLYELEIAREAIIEAMVAQMPLAHREFLLGFKRGEPEWDLLGVPGAAQLPAVQWKQLNLDRLSHTKRRDLIDALERVLFG
jgi:hypothetical protein